MKTNRLFVMITALIISVTAQAQEVFKIGGGAGGKSVYSNMIGTLAERCSTDAVQIQEVKSTGGPANLASLKANQVKAALVPADVMAVARYDNASSVANLKTLFVLHNEAAHLIARADTKSEGGVNLGFTKLGGKDVTFNTAEDLKGRVIGAVGGSAVTAKILSDMLKFGWKVEESYQNNDELIKALESGKLDAVMISAGLQSDYVKGIKGKFKLIPIRGNSDTQNVYGAIKVEYPNLGGGRAVDTLAARALMVARVFRSEEQIKTLADLRACFFRELPKIQDGDTHPAWQDVNPDERGDARYWYDLPKPAAFISAPIPPKKTK
jgi:TRAP-type uncharacterized transport system substrate-binding protein